MHLFFLALALTTTLLFGLSFYSAFVLTDPLLHFYFGLIATISCLLTHCWVFFYFIGTGQGIREGVLEHDLDLAAIKRTKKFKGKTFPFALFSMIFMIVASYLGGGVRFGNYSKTTHLVVVGIGVAFNLFAFFQEYRVIQENRKLMESLNKKIAWVNSF